MVCGVGLSDCQVHRGLGDAVHVGQQHVAAEYAVPAHQARRVQRLTGEDDSSKGTWIGVSNCHCSKRIERRGRLRQDGHPVCAQEGPQRLGVAHGFLVGQNNAGSGCPCGEDLEYRDVERSGVRTAEHVAGAEVVAGSGGVEQGSHVRVGDGHTFGTAGGS